MDHSPNLSPDSRLRPSGHGGGRRQPRRPAPRFQPPATSCSRGSMRAFLKYSACPSAYTQRGDSVGFNSQLRRALPSMTAADGPCERPRAPTAAPSGRRRRPQTPAADSGDSQRPPLSVSSGGVLHRCRTAAALNCDRRPWATSISAIDPRHPLQPTAADGKARHAGLPNVDPRTGQICFGNQGLRC
jgi:hypothetical protein